MNRSAPAAKSWTPVTTIAPILLGLTLGLAFQQPATASSLEGQPIERIELRCDTPSISGRRLATLLSVRVGSAFHRQAVARSLRNLQASGLVSEVEAYAEPSAGGVVLTFAMWGRIQIEELRLTGELGVKRKALLSVLQLQAGEPLIESRILRGVWELQDYYHELGFLDASVRSRPQVDEAAKQATVVYEIDSGRRFTVGSVDFDGPLSPFTAEQLEARLRMSPGRPYREQGARGDTERLEDWLVSQDHRLARVEEPRTEIDWDRAEVDVVFPITVGPRFHVEIAGADLKQLRKKGLLPFLDVQRFDEAIVLQSVARIRRHYQQLGHYRVQVDWEETRGEELVHLLMSIDRGPVYELNEIRFVGNEAVSSKQLFSLISTTPRRLLVPGSGRLVDDVLGDDLSNIRSFYRLEGYWDVEVGPPGVDSSGGDTLSLEVPILEGLQRRIVELSMTGMEAIDASEMQRRLSIHAGGPFHPILLDEAKSSIRARYEAAGFESVQITSTVSWDDSGTLAEVRFRVLEGPRSVVDRVVVRGNRRTKTRVIHQAMNIGSGDTFNTARLLEAQRALYNLGAFSSVAVRRAPGTPFTGERDILVDIEEGDRNNVTYGVGWNSEDGFSGLVGYTRSNLLGRGLSARLDLRGSERDSVARILLHQPYLGRFHLPTTASLFFIESTEESFTSRRRGGQLGIERVGDHSRLGLLFDYRVVEVSEVDPALEALEIDRDLQEVQIASLTPSWRRDHRNDPVDPVRGWSAALQLERAFPFLAADEEFVKGFAQYTRYLDLGRLGSVGGSLRLGTIQPIKKDSPDPTVPEGQPSAFIPISERFFAGGRATHRAYRRDRLGIPGETLVTDADDPGSLVPIGGNGLLLLNLDYRFPIAGPVGGAVFVDSGNVWGDWRSIAPAEAKTGVGVGVRYRSPIGPIRLEVGWKLDRLPSEDPYVVFLSFGNPY